MGSSLLILSMQHCIDVDAEDLPAEEAEGGRLPVRGGDKLQLYASDIILKLHLKRV